MAILQRKEEAPLLSSSAQQLSFHTAVTAVQASVFLPDPSVLF